MSAKARLRTRRVAAAGSVLLLLLFVSGCSHFRFNPAMCDHMASDVTQVIPQECYNYSEAAAAKASLPPNEDECLECSKSDKLEYRR